MMAHTYFSHNCLCIAVLLIIRIDFNLASVVPTNATVEGNESKSEPETCTTPECEFIASEIVKYMDTSVNPCDDFYEFSCGQFTKNFPIPEETGRIRKNDYIVEEFKKQFDALITESPPDSDPKYFLFANNFYKSCMNESYIEELKGSPMTDISNSLGGWPVLMKDEWNPNGTWKWEEATKQLYKLGFKGVPIISVSSNDFQRMTINYMKLNVPEAILLDRRSALQNIDSLGAYVNDSKLHKERSKLFSYYNYMVDMAVLFGAERDFAKKEFEKCLRFELDLAKAFKESRAWNYTTFKELPKNYSNEWVNYIKSLLPEDRLANGNETVTIREPKLFQELSTLLKNTSNRTIANFVMWRAHEYSTQFLSKFFRDRRALYYDLPMNKRSMECMDLTKERLSISINSHWAQKNLNSNKLAEAYKMFDNIKTSFEEFIEEADWMDNATKSEAQDTLKSLSIKIAIPDELLNNTKMEQYFHGLDIDSNKYLESNLRLNTFDLEKTFENFQVLVTSKKFISYEVSESIYAIYHQKPQHIASIWSLMLHDRIYNINGPQYANYGFLGETVAHEVAHAIFLTRTKWTNGSEQAYQAKVNCLINQYGNFSSKLTGQKINGNKTVNENIADNVGFKIWFRAYKKWNEEFGPEKSLPGLNYTVQQLLWIISGQRWCSNSSPGFERKRIESNKHSPPKFRVIGMRQNSKEFAEDFNCAVGSPMNPEKKCLF